MTYLGSASWPRRILGSLAGLFRRTWGDFRFEAGRVVRGRRRGRVESLVVWTVNEEDRLRAFAALGVDGIITDDPGLLRGIVGAA